MTTARRRTSGQARDERAERGIPEATVARLPVYLRALTSLSERRVATASSEELAAAAGVNSAKLRKDLSYLGTYGTRGVGYDVEYLRYQIAREIGLTQDWSVVIIGIGNLGHALANYSGFASRGFTIAALLDNDPERVGEKVGDLEISSFDELETIVDRDHVSIGVVATPATAAQDVADRLVAAGVTSILNFAPAVLSVPDSVDVRKVDLSIELQILAYHEQRKTHGGLGLVSDQLDHASGVPIAGGAEVQVGDSMSFLVIGVSHRTASLDLLERFAVQPAEAGKLAQAVLEAPHLTEAAVLTTCNRVEVYADVDRFHGSVEVVTALLAAHAGRTVEELVPAVYVHYDEATVAHLFLVAAGLDSMVVGEAQIMGQVRETLRRGQADETVGPALNALFQQGLRVGKRVHAETGIDQAGQTIISVALAVTEPEIGRIEGRRILVVGAGSMAALAVATAGRAGAGEIVVASRTHANARRIASKVAGRPVTMADLEREIAAADLVISCTGATGSVITLALVEAALMLRDAARPLVIADMALPHDVDPEVASLPGVTIVDLQTVATHGHEGAGMEDVAAVRDIVADEVVAFTNARDAARVAPTVVALRTMATAVASAELDRLWARMGDLTPDQRTEIEQAVRRVADKLLHEPTVRVKEFAGRTPEASYAEALAALFALDPTAVDAVTRAGEKA